ncbi:hypothetical protein L6639_40405 [Bradyrhizobium sp. WYCCWR 12678]|nr:hypothetical protein [Bradyrhizobium zhengyangense]MCG2645434.1 hypothetical protein [Bradyrhizobium zhengyangense]
MRVNKVTWDKIGYVTEPGRYTYTFGFLTITRADIEVWTQWPNAVFTLVARAPTEMSVGEEYLLGAFDIGSPQTDN